MALKQMRLRMRLEQLRAQMDEKGQARAALEARRAALTTREAEIEAAIAEVTEETPQEDRDMVEGQAAQWESDDAALTEEENANQGETEQLQRQIDDLQRELDELNARSERSAQENRERRSGAGHEQREEETTMNNRRFFGMNTQERDAFFAREDVKGFIARMREMKGQKRAVSGAELLIPTVVLGLIRENITTYSKLIKHINLRSVPGKARQIVAGTVPEAIWTEMCAKLNELSFGFGSVEVDGYKVGGFIRVCNAVLEDATDPVSLMQEIISMLGQAIGLALDKAILYGTGKKMPTGIMTRLAQTIDPENPNSSIPWKDVSASNVLAISGKTDAALFKALIEATGAAKGEYSRGGMFWAMNEKTRTKLVADSLTINAAGAITASQFGTMPVIGGAVETLSFIPDDVIIGGYGDLYLLAERAGTTIAPPSEEYRYVEDETYFKATARYDGLPVIAEAFVAIGIGGVAPAADAVTFGEDKANAA